MIDVSLLGELPAASSAKSPEAQQARVDEMRNRVDRLESKVETLKLGLHQILLDVSDLELRLLDLDDMEKARLKELLEKSPAAHIREEAQETYPDFVKNRAFSLSARNVDWGRKRLRSALPTPTSPSLESSRGSSSIAPLASPSNGSKHLFCKYCRTKGHTKDNCSKLKEKNASSQAPASLPIVSAPSSSASLGVVHLVLDLITNENTETIERADRIVLELIITHYPSSFDQSNTAIPLEGDTGDATEGEPEELSEDAVVGDDKAERNHL
ncbi:hypothetical protein BGW42_006039 [Actinomortierella wolfii]|nr:hypothetical protein BGW42_006039 [Actinomortierella wolfii]